VFITYLSLVLSFLLGVLQQKDDPEKVLEAFKKLDDASNPEVLAAFVATFFKESGSDLIEREGLLSDWVPSPALLSTLEDTSVREWAKAIHAVYVEGARERESERRNNNRKSKRSMKPSLISFSFLRFLHPFASFFPAGTSWVKCPIVRCTIIPKGTLSFQHSHHLLSREADLEKVIIGKPCSHRLAPYKQIDLKSS
jgi:hypothetical protein